MLYPSLRAVLFKLDAERSHDIALPLLNLVCGNPVLQPLIRRVQTPSGLKPVECMGLQFPNPVGLAAGMDKNADYLDGLGALGFGFIEVGTVTPRPQPGNPKPRMFRLTDEQAIINRLGFNNKGVDYLVGKVKNRRYQGILGINIGKNADTPLERANDDYLHCLEKVYPHADYVTVNISSPNTPGLRDLQHGTMLTELFTALKERQATLTDQHQRYNPIAVKIAPDMDDEQIAQFATAALAANIDAVIATNTTFSREGAENSVHHAETGGLSGAPLSTRATRTLDTLNAQLQGKIPTIGVGGIMDARTGLEKISAGASLIQVYTGFIYQGPQLVRSLSRALQQPENR